MAAHFVRLSLFAGVAVIVAAPAFAQASAAAPVASAKRVYTPGDFARFAPKTAYDMLAQVPGFTIRTPDNSERGLGQASENVLVNGQRIANKSGGAVDQLQRTSAATVDRIEIVDAASLGIAGLSGQVANVILKATNAGTGQFEWKTNARAHFTEPEVMGGSISYSNKIGPVGYTLSVKNNYGRGGLGGPVTLYDANHNVIEARREKYHSESEQIGTQLKLGIHPGSSIGNLTLGYTPYISPQFQTDIRHLANGEIRTRTNTQTLTGYFADINGDYEFALGSGRLKLIGVRHWEHEPLVVTDVTEFVSSGADPLGVRFDRDTRLGETITRAEYRWKTRKNDWQFSLERAFNSLDQEGRLFQLSPERQFDEVSFPEGTGKVTELRYEALGTLSRPLTSSLDLQFAVGAEISKLDRVPDDQPARKFFRPKGSLTLGWRPARDWDVSLKLRRRVGQISFYDFLAQPKLSSDRENAGNPDLVPPQSWEVETEFAHDLGKWGKTRLNFHYYRVTDIVDVIPIGEDGQGIGNLPRADRAGAESTSTINFDPIGWTGAKVDINAGFEWSSVRDPLTGQKRPITGNYDRWGSIQIRHDIPHTPFAWSAYVQYNHYAKNYYLTEVYRSLDLPWIAGFYVEDKNVMGLTVRFSVDNVPEGWHLFDRTVYSGFRDRAPIAFIEKHKDLVGPLFTLSVKGTF